jgi:tryptophanyl-tRNA synthetase
MSAKPGQNQRVVSGMRPTGQLHLGNYHGALANWVELQYRYECYFFVADWHALTTDYENTADLKSNTNEVLIDWLAAGLNPSACTIFVQSRVPEHAELHLILSMVTPVSWLERVPTYKDQMEQLKDKDLSTYGFLGYPLLQSADILMYRPEYVPVGEDQVAHVEITREIARRFNNIYGRETDFEEKATPRSTTSSGGSSRNKVTRTRWRGPAPWSNQERVSPLRTVSDFSATWKAGAARSYRNLLRSSRGLRKCPASMAGKCRSPTATRSGCARTRKACRRSSRRCRRIPRACAASTLAILTNALSGISTRFTLTRRRRNGCRRVAGRPVSAVSTARSL